MIRKDEMRAIADMQAAIHSYASFFERLDLGNQRCRIDTYACADHRLLPGPQDSAGNQLQNKPIFSNDDRMTRVMAAGAARDAVKRTSKIVNNLTLALVSPLRADDHD